MNESRKRPASGSVTGWLKKKAIPSTSTGVTSGPDQSTLNAGSTSLDPSTAEGVCIFNTMPSNR